MFDTKKLPILFHCVDFGGPIDFHAHLIQPKLGIGREFARSLSLPTITASWARQRARARSCSASAQGVGPQIHGVTGHLVMWSLGFLETFGRSFAQGREDLPILFGALWQVQKPEGFGVLTARYEARRNMLGSMGKSCRPSGQVGCCSGMAHQREEWHKRQ